MLTSNRSGRHEGLDQVLLDHLNALYGFAMILTKDHVEAEDLVQETYLRALQNLERFKASGKLKVWLFTILRNVWINQQRARRTRTFLDIQEEATAVYSNVDGNDPGSLLDQKVLRSAVRGAIESLLVDYREVIILRDIEGCSYREIAEILNCPIGTVMSRLGRARSLLRQTLSEHVK